MKSHGTPSTDQARGGGPLKAADQEPADLLAQVDQVLRVAETRGAAHRGWIFAVDFVQAALLQAP